jgi:hypothetical protein
LNSLQSSLNLTKIYDKNGWYAFEIVDYDQLSLVRSIDDVVLINDSKQVYNLADPTVGVIYADDDIVSLLDTNILLESHSLTPFSSNSPGELPHDNSSRILSASKVSPVKRSLSLNISEQPFLLAFLETFDKGWGAKTFNGTTLKSFPLYSLRSNKWF